MWEKMRFVLEGKLLTSPGCKFRIENLELRKKTTPNVLLNRSPTVCESIGQTGQIPGEMQVFSISPDSHRDLGHSNAKCMKKKKKKIESENLIESGLCFPHLEKHSGR